MAVSAAAAGGGWQVLSENASKLECRQGRDQIIELGRRGRAGST